MIFKIMALSKSLDVRTSRTAMIMLAKINKYGLNRTIDIRDGLLDSWFVVIPLSNISIKLLMISYRFIHWALMSSRSLAENKKIMLSKIQSANTLDDIVNSIQKCFLFVQPVKCPFIENWDFHIWNFGICNPISEINSSFSYVIHRTAALYFQAVNVWHFQISTCYVMYTMAI